MTRLRSIAAEASIDDVVAPARHALAGRRTTKGRTHERTNERTNGNARAERLSIAAASLMSVMATGCLNTTPGFIAPDGRIHDPAHGTYFVRRDNPFLTGLYTLGVREEWSAFDYSSARLIAPDGVTISATPASAVPDTQDWAWSDAPVSPTGAQFFTTVRFPRVLLPMGGEPVRFTMTAWTHRVRTEPTPPGTTPPALGFDVEVIDTMDVALDPHVLLLPVRVHHFVHSGERALWADRRYFERTLDRGAVETVGCSSETDGHAGRFLRCGLGVMSMTFASSWTSA